MDMCQSRLQPLASLVENETIRLAQLSLPIDCVVLIFLEGERHEPSIGRVSAYPIAIEDE